MKKQYGIPLVWMEYGRVWVEAESEAEAIAYALGPDCPLPEGVYLDESVQVDEELPIMTYELPVRITKKALRERLLAGESLDRIMNFRRGQECFIFKADTFCAGQDILYIPDVDLNEIPVSEDMSADIEGVMDILGCCYTGDDFVRECDGDVELAERLFDYCDWQHPSSALPEVREEEDSEGNEEKTAK